MGYHTDFDGELKFTKELSASQLAKLNAMLEDDCRDHPEWEAPGLYYIDLKLLKDFSGLEWNGAEKTYDMDKLVNVVIRVMRKEFPDFGLTGRLLAQGEEIDDRWELVINKDGFAERKDIPFTGSIITCPHCGEKFRLGEEE